MPRWLMQLRLETAEIAEELDSETHWLTNFRASMVIARIDFARGLGHSLWLPIP